MSVVIQYEEAGPWRKRLTIEVPAPAVEAETGRVVKELGRSVDLPGFRKGKVPASLILKRFPGEIEHRVTERLVPRYWHQAEAEKSLDTLTQPNVEDVRFEPGASMTFVAVVETRPEIELRNIDDFTLPEADAEPSEGDVTQALRELRRQGATWKEVDRAAATGDIVKGAVHELSGDGEDGEEGSAQGSSQPLRIELGGAGVDEELSLALTGLKAGQKTSFTRPLGEGPDAQQQEYRIEVESVEEEELPELDDDFAVKMGVKDAADLTERVTSQLRDGKRGQLRNQREAALLEQLRERHPLELPEGVVDREVEQMLHAQAARMSAQGIDLETASIDWQDLGGQMRPEARKRVHNRLVLDAVAKEKDIRLDEAEFERVLAGIAREQKKSSLVVRQELDANGRLSMLRADLLERQTLTFLVDGGKEEPAQDPDDSA